MGLLTYDWRPTDAISLIGQVLAQRRMLQEQQIHNESIAVQQAQENRLTQAEMARQALEAVRGERNNTIDAAKVAEITSREKLNNARRGAVENPISYDPLPEGPSPADATTGNSTDPDILARFNVNPDALSFDTKPAVFGQNGESDAFAGESDVASSMPKSAAADAGSSAGFPQSLVDMGAVKPGGKYWVSHTAPDGSTNWAHVVARATGPVAKDKGIVLGKDSLSTLNATPDDTVQIYPEAFQKPFDGTAAQPTPSDAATGGNNPAGLDNEAIRRINYAGTNFGKKAAQVQTTKELNAARLVTEAATATKQAQANGMAPSSMSVKTPGGTVKYTSTKPAEDGAPLFSSPEEAATAASKFKDKGFYAAPLFDHKSGKYALKFYTHDEQQQTRLEAESQYRRVSSSIHDYSSQVATMGKQVSALEKDNPEFSVTTGIWDDNGTRRFGVKGKKASDSTKATPDLEALYQQYRELKNKKEAAQNALDAMRSSRDVFSNIAIEGVESKHFQNGLQMESDKANGAQPPGAPAPAPNATPAASPTAAPSMSPEEKASTIAAAKLKLSRAPSKRAEIIARLEAAGITDHGL